MRNLYYIAIQCPIGVGKTSLANLMSKSLGPRLVLEEFEENPFLPDFYIDPERSRVKLALETLTPVRPPKGSLI